MDIGIVAASLIAMRPCFKAISKSFKHIQNNDRKFSVASLESSSRAITSGAGSHNREQNGIVRTFEFEVELDPKEPTTLVSSTTTSSKGFV